LGKYYFPEGEARVTLSDKGGEIPPIELGNGTLLERKQTIIADAMKWRYTGNRKD
jgi:hypothetical protein